MEEHLEKALEYEEQILALNDPSLLPMVMLARVMMASLEQNLRPGRRAGSRPF